jgi:hypothetical protein
MVCTPGGWCQNQSLSSPTKKPNPTPKPTTTQTTTSKSSVKYDFNLNGKLEEKDVQIIQEYIVSLPQILYDINNDNQVDIVDTVKLIDIYNETTNKKLTPTSTSSPTPTLKPASIVKPNKIPTLSPTKKPTITPTIKTKINLIPNILNLEVGKSWKVKAITTPDRKSVSYIWISNNRDIATVNIDGLVTGKKAGKTNIKITIKNTDISSNLEVIVKNPISTKTPTPTPKSQIIKPTSTPTLISNQNSVGSSTSFNPIIPRSFKDSFLTDTLKIWRTRPNSYYSVYSIWAKEPYKQLHTYSASSYGKERDSIGNIMKNAIKNTIDPNKLAILFNGFAHVSYFEKGGTLPPTYYKEYYNAGLIIEEGKVLRDDPSSNNKARSNFAAIDNQNNLIVHKASDYNSDDNRKIFYDKIKSNGALNTIFVMGGNLLRDGISADNNRENSYQGFCQVNKNNFVFVVIDPDDRKAISINKLGNILKNLGCQNAYILDGGGSSNVWLKEQSSTKVRNFQGDKGSRGRMWNIFYWTEL